MIVYHTLVIVYHTNNALIFQDIVTETMYGTIEILRGMIGQMAEADDMYVVEDLRSE